MTNTDPELLSTIEQFEQFLQAMPNDRQTLEILAVAYAQAGLMDKQKKALISLSRVLVSEGDYEHAKMIAENLRAFAGEADAEAAADAVEEAIKAVGPDGGNTTIDGLPEGSFDEEMAKASAEALSGTEKPAEAATVPDRDPMELIQIWTSTATTAEAEIVWDWKDRQVLPEEPTSEILHLLMDNPAPRGAFLVSALGLLEEHHAELTDVAFEDHRRRCGLAPVPIELFDVGRNPFNVLPEDFVKVKGVLPFGKIGGEHLVAVLNGLNKDLREEVEKMAGAPCHFFLMHPHAWYTWYIGVFGDEKHVQ